jgi:spermidine synthase
MVILTEISNPSFPISYEGTLIASKDSDLQKWSILDISSQGPTLFINGQLQSCLKDEYMYHEMFVHPLFSGLEKPKKVLILGGAEGCTLREVLRWPVESVVQVDWDTSLVSYFQDEESWNKGAYKDPRVQLHFTDALEWLTSCTETFDAVFIDLFDPDESEFYKNIIKNVKKISKAITINAGNVESAEPIAFFMKQQFPSQEYQRIAIKTFVPSFLGEWCFLTVCPKDWSTNFHTSILPPGLQRYTKSELIYNYWAPDYPLILKNFNKEDGIFRTIKKLEENSHDCMVDWYDFQYNGTEFCEIYT